MLRMPIGKGSLISCLYLSRKNNAVALLSPNVLIVLAIVGENNVYKIKLFDITTLFGIVLEPKFHET